MAAVAAIFDQLAAGSVVTLPRDCYQGVASLAERGRAKGSYGVQRSAYDAFFAGTLEDYELPESEIRRALDEIKDLPKPV
jgi:hypothetical protein